MWVLLSASEYPRTPIAFARMSAVWAGTSPPYKAHKDHCKHYILALWTSRDFYSLHSVHSPRCMRTESEPVCQSPYQQYFGPTEKGHCYCFPDIASIWSIPRHSFGRHCTDQARKTGTYRHSSHPRPRNTSPKDTPRNVNQIENVQRGTGPALWQGLAQRGTKKRTGLHCRRNTCLLSTNILFCSRQTL
jgi:hypothetical protein